ncbi:katanin p80 WD40 repeat-containing subunit B1 isoform X1 [Leptopilina heterotoma]|uniref:katanin p80 WD40 repeat-containing subunit B1 isoform X1 n=1 Tax=Leptopilina heterotoma TaxID=63436 RepID=UPI001CA7D482|nr:katanin p80 WD40 repeat-containing subunit B1 isoform X1 [Leptopilina heterotoma]
MASSTRKSWKLQEFVAHSSMVNCLSLGHKSGRVMVTGGDDKKVNLWAVGKQNCIMSLSGHTTPVECVRFGQTEDLVCAGSQTGALKIWDLEHAKLSRTLTGHKSGIRCIDFHPYGELVTSGSTDTAIKLWDIRRKGCIFTYKGHNRTVNSLKFSPDGQWIASAGEEGMVKLWDLRAGRQLKEFSGHRGSATTVEFHPHEFLLASGSVDRIVHFWDLESFQLVSSSEQNNSAIRCLFFSSGGECLYVGSQDVLKVYAWEPARTLDTIPTGWGKVQDIAIAQNQLIGASCHMSSVVLYVCDIKKPVPGGDLSGGLSFSHGNSLRKSFSKEKPPDLKKHTLNVKTIEEVNDKSGTDPEDEVTYAEIPNVSDYQDIFQPNRSLSRTPPPEKEFLDPQEIDPAQPQILRNLSSSMLDLNNEEADDESKSKSLPPPPVSTLTKSLPVRVHPIKSSPPLHRNVITSTSQIKANLQANSLAGNRNSKNLVPIPPMRQSITPLPGKKSIPSVTNSLHTIGSSQPLGPQRSNSTLTPRVAPMAAVAPVIDDAKLKSRVPSPDSPKQYLKRQSSCKEGEQGYESDYPVQINNIRHSPSDPALNRPSTAQSRTSIGRNFVNSSPLSARNISTTRKTNKAQVAPNQKTDTRIAQLRPTINNVEKEEFVPMTANRPYGLDMETFLPNNYKETSALVYSQVGVLAEMSEAEVLSSMMRGHESMMAVLTNRHRSLQIIYSLWHNKDLKSAIDSAVAMNDLSVIVDLLGILTLKSSIWNLDLCNSFLIPIKDLLQSKYEMYVTVGCSALRLILRNFAPVIKSNVEAPLHTIGVDVSREERYHKCHSCYEKLMTIRSVILKKIALPGKLGASFRELDELMKTIE